MTEITSASATELADRIRSGETTSVEVTQAFLDQIESCDTEINAFITVDAARALAQASAVDARIAAGEPIGGLAGVPVAVKDNFCYENMPTTAGSKMLATWQSPYTSTVVQRLCDSQAVILGKTNMDEFAMGGSTETSAFGPTRNPWDLSRVPGGSGGGSAAALAADMAPLALGSDTGGSIRNPASHTGTVGMKPTYGSVSRFGVIAMASSLDQPGPAARNVADTAALHQIIAGHDPLDSTSINAAVPDFVAAVATRDLTGKKIGVIRQLSELATHPAAAAALGLAIEQAGSLGAEIVEFDCPNFDYAYAAYYIIMPAEVSSNMSRYDGMRYGLRVGDDPDATAESVMKASRAAGFGTEVKRRIIIGTHVLSAGHYDAYYRAAGQVRSLVRDDFDRVFASCDAVIAPSALAPAFALGEKIDDPLQMYRSDLCTVPMNLAGNAALTIPVTLDQTTAMPIGVQIVANAGRDDMCYAVGGALEAALDAARGHTMMDTKRQGGTK